jgi:hypothetical protein
MILAKKMLISTTLITCSAWHLWAMEEFKCSFKPVEIWSLERRTKYNKVHHIAFSLNSEKVVFSTDNWTIEVWDVKTGAVDISNS